MRWPSLPDEIAIHFNTAGTPDGWGSKYFLIGLPIISVLLWFLIGFLTRNPEKMNYINLTEANKEIQYEKMKKVMLLIQHTSFIALILANESMLRNAAGLASEIAFYSVFLFLAITVIAPFYLLVWSATLKY
jgi:uncharacterized membrane protein